MRFSDIETDDRGLIEAALAAYDIGNLQDAAFHSGTAAKSWRVRSDRGEYLLRTRGTRTSGDDLVAFDHALRHHLIAHGVPTAVPMTSRGGAGVVRVEGRTLELYPLLEGTCASRVTDAQVVSAARLLARFHEATRSFSLARSLPPVSQYRTLGFEDNRSRMEDPVLLERVYSGLAEEPGCDAYADNLAVARRWLDRLLGEFGDDAYTALPHTVTHGDYTPANILFSGDDVVGVFDFDWARWAPRVRDLADGLFFVSGERRTPLEPKDIWSLTEAVALSVPRAALWLSSYHAASPITVEELTAVPLALAARWLSVRVEGTAKVHPDDRLRFALANVAEPLDWLEQNWHAVRDAFLS
jgi:Ser/Thr protein kinase RdoA (MazF antagonist)